MQALGVREVIHGFKARVLLQSVVAPFLGQFRKAMLTWLILFSMEGEAHVTLRTAQNLTHPALQLAAPT
jgi:hypothetical protein